MRIVHVQHPYVPGLGYQENHLPRAQQDLSHEVHIVTTDFVPEKFRDASLDLSPGIHRDNGVDIHRLPSVIRLRSIDDVVMKGLTAKLDQLRPDVIHSHGLLSFKSLQTAQYARRRDTSLVFDVHVDNDNFHLDRPYKVAGFHLYRSLFLRWLYGESTAVLPVNPLAKQFLERQLDAPPEKIRFLPLGVDTELFSPDRTRRLSIRETMGLSDDDPLVIFAGNIEPSKDLDLLLRAFARLSASDERARLLILGSGDDGYLDSLAGLATELGVRSRTTFHDRVPHGELSDYYNAADVGVWPGKLGISIIEAIGTGLPIVVCDSTATSFLVENDNGLVFTRGDVDALSDRLETYLRDPDLRASHASNAVELANERLSWDRIAERSIEIYREAESERSGRTLASRRSRLP